MLSGLFDNFGHQKQARFDRGCATLVGLALIGFAGYVLAQAQALRQRHVHRVRHGRDAAGVNRAHFFNNAKKIIELRAQTCALRGLQAKPGQASQAVDINVG